MTVSRALPYLWALVGVAAVSAVIGVVSAQMPIAHVSILYLPVVLLTAARGGRGPAIAASLASFLAYDVLFIEPRFHLTVADPQDWVTLLLLLLAAVVTGQVTADLRARERDAQRREREAILLHDVARLMGDADLDRALAEVAERVRRELGLAGVAIEIGAGRRIASGDEGARHELQAILIEDRRVGTILALGPRGRAPSRDEDRMLAAVSAQLSAAIERERLRREAAETEVLRSADDAKRALLHAASHDLRTPLSSIIAGATSLRQRDVRWSDDEREEFLAGIEDEARRLDRVVGDLLSASRIEAGTLRPVKDWHDVGDLVDDVVGRLRSRAPRHRIVVDVADDLPPAKLDRMEIAQALGNLIENATKYASDGTEVVVSARLDGDAVLIQVSDRGPGVSADAARRIFEPFERAAREGTAGSGLGLAVAKSFVEAHGGRIWIEPRTGGGSTFAFTLPRTA
jgi:two-component system sensor histidine kinase KdpD